MRFRSIQRCRRSAVPGNLEQAWSGRNPYEIQVNTKFNDNTASNITLNVNGRNPYEIQVNTKVA